MICADSPPITRRSTRSSLAASVDSKIAVETPKAADGQPLTINDLVHHDEPISFDELISNFPGRRSQIIELLRLLGPLNSPMFPAFVYGGTSTGKTSVVLSIFRHLRRPFVYSSCITCYNPRILFESILNQLLLHRKCEGNGYSSAKRCEKPPDFVNLLRQALSGIIGTLKGNIGRSSSKKVPKRPNGQMIYLIFDNIQLLRDIDCSLLPFLFKLHDILRMPEVGLIFISNTSPDTFYSDTGHVEPIPVHFPDYTEDDLCEIFMKNQAHAKLYSSFLDVVLRPFCRVTRRINEISAAFALLFKIYCEPVGDMGDVSNEDMKRKLFYHLQPNIAKFLNETFNIQSHNMSGISLNKENKKQKGTAKKFGSNESSNEIGFSMSTSARYLLISAFLASRNPATLDASFFDSTGGSDNRKRKRKSSEKSMENKETAEIELHMKGPGTFPLERLLAIFQCITSFAEPSCNEEGQADGGLGVDNYSNMLMSDVLLQLSSLCNVNFVSKGGSCSLEGSTRYRCNVSEDLALKVARSLKFPLTKYLYRR